MDSVLEVIRLVIGISTGFSGTALNVWIIVVNVLDWRKVGSLSSIDLILSFIGLVNAIQQVNLTLDLIFTGFPSSIHFAGEAHLLCLKVLIGLATCNLWFTVWLSTYYCCRIVNFTSGILFWLKIRIPILIPKLLAVSIFMAICITVPSTWNVYLLAENPGQNATHGQRIIVTTVPYLLALLIGTIIPLMLTLIPTVVTLISLWRHTKRMKKNTPDFSFSQRKAHIMAARTIVLLLTLHMAFCAVAILIVLSSFNTEHILQFLAWYFAYFYYSTQAVVLINGNAKLKRAGPRTVKQAYSRCAVICPGPGEGDH